MNNEDAPETMPRPISGNFRVVIVDDEPLARVRLHQLLGAEPDVEIVGEYGSGREAAAGIRETRPDLVFLDIQMPDCDGFEVINEVGVEEMPVIVFVTAFDEYALQAFGVHAADYLLKPYDQARFQGAMRQGREHVLSRRAGLGEPAPRPPAEEASGGRYVDRLAIRSSGRVVLVRVEEIDWLESAGNYVSLHLGRKTHLIRETLSGLEKRLDPARFVRIHRCTIVQIDRVRELETYFHGEYKVILQDGTQLTLSRNYRENLSALTGAAF
jgi:two-component system LytT family response regulator